MKLYAAPLEVLTESAWRRAQRDVFGGTDKYFTPFLVAHQTHKFKERELLDLSQEEENLVPQLLTNNAEHFIWAARELQQMGYHEVNFNLGCPSATVVSRGKGSGLLRTPYELEDILDQIYDALPDMTISLKTRLGFEDPDEWWKLLELYKQYPVSELIIHPRLRQEFYKGHADREIFLESLNKINLRLVYNGDIYKADDAIIGLARGSDAADWAGSTSPGAGFDIMVGRGLLRDPSLFRQIQGGSPAGADELKSFHDRIIEYYSQISPSEGPILHHLKSIWVYLIDLFEFQRADLIQMRQARSLADYRPAAEKILAHPKQK